MGVLRNPTFFLGHQPHFIQGATTVATYMAMIGNSDPVTHGLGLSLYSLWTDLPPRDNNLDLTIGGL
jgi:hypothetical protein